MGLRNTMTMSCVMGQSLSRWDALQLSSCHPHRPPQAHHLVITTSFRGTNGGTGRQSHLPQVHSSYVTELGLDPSSSISKACVLSSQAVLSLLHMIKPTGPTYGPCPVCLNPQDWLSCHASPPPSFVTSALTSHHHCHLVCCLSGPRPP